MSKTTFDKKCEILADIWLNYRDEEEFQSFVENSELALPLAYCFQNDIITEKSKLAKALVEEAFDLLLGALGMDEDFGWKSLDDLLEYSAEHL